jgi:hypothetical protein
MLVVDGVMQVPAFAAKLSFVNRVCGIAFNGYFAGLLFM